MSTIIGAVDARFCIDILFAIPLLSERICCNTKSVKETVFYMTFVLDQTKRTNIDRH